MGSGLYANEYSIWMECEDHAIDYYDHQSYFYLFNLEEADSNPYGATKESNEEAILRKCFDYSKQVYGGTNLTHSSPCGGSRKLMDMFLCEDGLPIHMSPLFKGYHGLRSEFEHRDARMQSGYKQVGQYYWCSTGEKGNKANYSIAPYEDASNKSGIYAPPLTTYNTNAYDGRKFTQERNRPDNQESADFMVIRLPEMLLTYAEATMELSGKISDSELAQTINVIRKRAHIADLTNGFVTKHGLDMKEEIRRERAIELYGEGFRFNDLCRWGIAETELRRITCSFYIAYNGSPTELATEDKPGYPGMKIYDAKVWEKDYILNEELPQSDYKAGIPTVKPGCLVIARKSDRNFSRKNYLQAIPTDQIALNPELKQNPQW